MIRPTRSVPRRTLLRAATGAAVGLPLAALTGCSGGSVDDPDVIRVAYQQFGSGTLIKQWIARTTDSYRQEFPDRSVEPLPIVAAENDYFTKNELLMSSRRTSPDVVYEDSFILLSDVGAGYIRPLDQYVEKWKGWDQIAQASRDAVTGEDGKVYAVPVSTDTRALWVNTDVLEKAGLPRDFAPEDWDELLEAARTIKKKLPDVAPLFVFSGKSQGEKASMQGFEMLLYGTGEGKGLYDDEKHRWVTGSKGFLDSLEFIRTLFSEQLTLPVARNLDPNIGETIYSQLLPEGKVAMVLDGSWISQNWDKGAAKPWPEWTEVMRTVRMPTQHGQGRGWVTLAGGWCWTLPQYVTDPDIGFSFIEALCETDNLVQRAIEDNHISVRKDVAADERYLSYSPTVEFFTDLLEGAYYRPALPVYPEVSSAIQEAMESVMTMDKTPEAAQAEYDRAVTEIVGAEAVEKEAS